jgi:hypothetical protein
VAGQRATACLARAGKAGRPKPAMHGHEKSDRRVVPRKFANKAGRPAAEQMEGRRLVKGRLAGKPRSGHRTGFSVSRVLAQSCCVTAWVAQTPNGATVSPETGARCGKAARRDLCGGLAARPVPTATGQAASQ